MNNKYNWMFVPFFLLMLVLGGCRGDLNDPAVDTDGDGVPDVRDNCPLVFNPNQEDSTGDGIGDACLGDWDGDGIPDDQDECPADPTNTCLADTDGDGIPDIRDNCPAVANPSQDDMDGDGVGDACDDDIDGDGVPNDTDNCPNAFNPGQADRDSDGIGDACDDDRDGDGIPNDQDSCPDDPDTNCTDPTAGVDTDGDGIPDNVDNCPAVANPSQKDTDGDGIGDDCDDDIDGDGVLNDTDNCPNVFNPGQEDADADGVGDACDQDFSCRSDLPFKPLLQVSEADASLHRTGLCGLLCSIDDEDNITDGTGATGADSSTAASTSLFIAANLLGLDLGYTYAEVKAGLMLNNLGNNHRAGFLINKTNTILSLNLIPRVELEFLNGSTTVRRINDVNLLDLRLLGLGNNQRLFVGAEVDQPYDSMRIYFKPTVGVNESYNIFSACYMEN